MIGAIIGDIAGSRFEFNNHRSKEFDLFTDTCFATDDSIMTLAVARAIMEAERSAGSADRDDAFYSALGGLTAKSMREIGQRYPHCGYGGRFQQWMFSRNPRPYNSFGNGAAMRVSPTGFAARTLSEVRRMSEAVTMDRRRAGRRNVRESQGFALYVAAPRRDGIRGGVLPVLRDAPGVQPRRVPEHTRNTRRRMGLRRNARHRRAYTRLPVRPGDDHGGDPSGQVLRRGARLSLRGRNDRKVA